MGPRPGSRSPAGPRSPRRRRTARRRRSSRPRGSRPACRRRRAAASVDHRVGHRAVALAGHHHHRQRVHHRGVEAGGDDDELRLEALHRGHDDALDRRLVGAVAGARGQRHVDVGALAGALAGVLDPAPIRPGRGRPGGGRSSARRGRRRRRARCRCRGGRPSRRSRSAPGRAPRGRVRPRSRCWRRCRSPRAFVALGVVARGAVQRVGIVDIAVPDRLDRGDHAAGGERADLVAAAAEWRQFAAVAAALHRFRADPRRGTRRVDAEDLLVGRLARPGDRASGRAGR